MPQDIRLWAIEGGDSLKEIKRSRLDWEERIEKWLEQDISIVSDDLLVIGRQVETDFGGVIDLLCLDQAGDLVIIELKRDKTPRGVTAQALDYASWVRGLSSERVIEIASRYFGGEVSLEDAYKQRFGEELPEVLNEHHQMLIVASEVDSSSERIINYLSDTYGVAINAVTFQYFQDEVGQEFLARVFLIEPSEVEYKSQTRGASKRRPPLTYEELQAIANRKGVGELYERLVEELTKHFDQRTTTRSTVAFIGVIDGSRRTILSLVPGESEAVQGVRYSLYVERLAKYLGVGGEEIVGLLPPDFTEGRPWKDAPLTLYGFFSGIDEARRFVEGLQTLRREEGA
ncbi:MAG: DUF91 domain-containing protein [Calditrichaeota bacterium]|nr:MAG: DUF91 domain-containing protein [Calditrichota bacterium]